MSGVKKTVNELIAQQEQFVADCEASGFTAASGFMHDYNITTSTSGRSDLLCMIGSAMAYHGIRLAQSGPAK